MGRTAGYLHGRSARWLPALLVLVLLLAALLPLPTGAKIWGDVGDAPDSTNHHGVGMTAYPWSTSKAAFPTVYDGYTGKPQGPLHWYPLADAWLGKSASSEADADLGYDEDPSTNIDPPGNKANRDGYDDGVIFPPAPSGIWLPQCQKSTFDYIVNAPALTMGHPMYVNVWFDFNRDGDWADVLACQVSPGGPTIRVAEWAVQNQVVSVLSGAHTITTPTFYSTHPSGNQDIWMRITLSESKAPPSSSTTALADGRGPDNGYQYGETEDYYLRYCAPCAGAAYYGGP